MTLAAGTRFGTYEIIAPLGAGGMGEVYRARDTSLGREVAIKVLPVAFAGDDERLRRFVQEAQATAALNHPNILAIHQVGQHEGAPFIVSELLNGETLRDRLHAGALPVRKAIDYAVQIARGLGAAHEKGIIHRDLKPENVFVTDDGRVKILDFGIAKLAGPADTAADRATMEVQTGAGAVLGTIGYMSPEQVRGQAVDARSDLFAFGAILHEMLSGRRAFKKDTAADTMTAVLHEDPPDLSTADRRLPPALERIVKRCLEKSPHERFQSARDLAFALEDVTSASTGHVAAADGAADRRPRPRLTAAVAAVLIAAIAGAAGAFWRGRSSVPEAQPTFQRLTFRRGSVLHARFAPDGKTVVYGAAWDGNPPEIFQVTGDSPESRALGVPRSDVYAVSANGELAVSLRRNVLARLPLLGGAAPREVLDKVEWADWAPDGSLAVTLDTGVGDRLEYPPGTPLYETTGPIHQIRVSPDGQLVAFQEDKDGRSAIALIDRAKKKTTVSGGWLDVLGLAWTRTGDEIWFAGKRRDDGWGLFAVTPAGRVRLVMRTPGQVRLEDVSRDGRVLLSYETAQTGIRYGGPDAQETDLSWLDRSSLDDMSRDGQSILFSEIGEAGGSDGAVYLRKVDGSPAVRLGDGVGVALSPDATWALTMSRSGSELNLLPTGAGTPKRLKGSLPRYWGDGRWLPDGKRVVYQAMESGHDPRLYVQDVSGDPKPISPEGLISRDWAVSPDGSRVAVVIGGKGLLLSTSGGPAEPAAALGQGDAPLGWSADGRTLYVRRGPEISRLDLSTGTRAPLKTVGPSDRAGYTGLGRVALSADARAYAYSYSRLLSELHVVTGLN